MITLHLTFAHVDTMLTALMDQAYELEHNATDEDELKAAKRIDEVVEALNDQL